MEQLKKGLESGTVLIQFEVRDPQGLGGLPDGCRVPQVVTRRRGGWGPWPIPELCLPFLF